MAGYYNFSMSNNAIQAYSEGEKPYTKWTKSDILQALKVEIKESIIELKADIKTIEKISLENLKTYCLRRSSWHHTSNRFNKTDFYTCDFSSLEALTESEIITIIARQKIKAVKEITEPKKIMKKCRFLTWEGTRKYPKPIEHIEVCEILGNWAITSQGKKSTKGNGFSFLD
jgi:hypothetical protein